MFDDERRLFMLKESGDADGDGEWDGADFEFLDLADDDVVDEDEDDSSVPVSSFGLFANLVEFFSFEFSSEMIDEVEDDDEDEDEDEDEDTLFVI